MDRSKPTHTFLVKLSGKRERERGGKRRGRNRRGGEPERTAGEGRGGEEMNERGGRKRLTRREAQRGWGESSRNALHICTTLSRNKVNDSYISKGL